MHEDLPSSLFIQKLAIFEVKDQSRFYALNCEKGPNFVAESRNMEFIVKKRNVATIDQRRFSDIFGMSLCLFWAGTYFVSKVHHTGP